MPIPITRNHWEDIRSFIPDDWITMKELAAVAEMAPTRVLHGLMYARERGLVEEGTKVYVDSKGKKYRKSIYRKKNTG